MNAATTTAASRRDTRLLFVLALVAMVVGLAKAAPAMMAKSIQGVIRLAFRIGITLVVLASVVRYWPF